MLKYKSLCIEIQRMLNLKCTIVPVIIGATGIVTRSLRKNLEAVPGKHSIGSLQKTAVLGTSHIIRKVLQCEAWSLSGWDHCWFKRIIVVMVMLLLLLLFLLPICQACRCCKFSFQWFSYYRHQISYNSIWLYELFRYFIFHWFYFLCVLYFAICCLCLYVVLFMSWAIWLLTQYVIK